MQSFYAELRKPPETLAGERIQLVVILIHSETMLSRCLTRATWSRDGDGYRVHGPFDNRKCRPAEAQPPTTSIYFLSQHIQVRLQLPKCLPERRPSARTRPHLKMIPRNQALIPRQATAPASQTQTTTSSQIRGPTSKRQHFSRQLLNGNLLVGSIALLWIGHRN